MCTAEDQGNLGLLVVVTKVMNPEHQFFNILLLWFWELSVTTVPQLR